MPLSTTLNKKGVVIFYQETLRELLDLMSEHSLFIWHQPGRLTLSGHIVEHLVCCVVDYLPAALRHVLYFCSTQFFLKYISCQDANFERCVLFITIMLPYL